jgi:hypothetical protein
LEKVLDLHHEAGKRRREKKTKEKKNKKRREIDVQIVKMT